MRLQPSALPALGASCCVGGEAYRAGALVSRFHRRFRFRIGWGLVPPSLIRTPDSYAWLHLFRNARSWFSHERKRAGVGRSARPGGSEPVPHAGLGSTAKSASAPSAVAPMRVSGETALCRASSSPGEKFALAMVARKKKTTEGGECSSPVQRELKHPKTSYPLPGGSPHSFQAKRRALIPTGGGENPSPVRLSNNQVRRGISPI